MLNAAQSAHELGSSPVPALVSGPSKAASGQLVAAGAVRKIAIVGLLLLGACIFLELVFRVGVGLGDPPLYQADSAMEYLLQPSKTYHRFHNTISVNRYGMRADDFLPSKSDRRELRILIVGDSIIYGGVRIDQSEISTEILKRQLQKELARPVVVGNGSAKSWGPPNELAYLRRYGTLDADVIILELSSHDYADAPTFVPVVGISSDYPDRKPYLAWADLLETYIFQRYLHLGATPPGVDRTSADAAHTEQDIAECREAERSFFSYARQHAAKVALVQHLSQPELTGKYETGYFANQDVAREERVPFVDDAPELREQMASGKNPFYRGDPLHLNRVGQVSLAQALCKAFQIAAP